jgi:hypothetical protein
MADGSELAFRSRVAFSTYSSLGASRKGSSSCRERTRESRHHTHNNVVYKLNFRRMFDVWACFKLASKYILGRRTGRVAKNKQIITNSSYYFVESPIFSKNSQ